MDDFDGCLEASQELMNRYFTKTFKKEEFYATGRTMLYPFQKYSKITIENSRHSGFEKFHASTWCSIISPFRSSKVFKSFLQEINSTNIQSYPADRIINEKMIEAVIEYSIHKEKPSRKEILDEYAMLIRDIGNCFIQESEL